MHQQYSAMGLPPEEVTRRLYADVMPGGDSPQKALELQKWYEALDKRTAQQRREPIEEEEPDPVEGLFGDYDARE